MDLADVAEIIGVDVIELALAEHGIGLTHYDVVISIASALDVEVEDLYPSLAPVIQSLETFDGDPRVAMLDPECAQAFRAAGIDPDIAAWYAIVKLKSGNERRYRMSSDEKDKIREELMSLDNRNGYMMFMADCRHVAIRRDAIAEVRFTNKASYAAFSSDESAFNVLIVSPRSPRPEMITVEPDGGMDGRGTRPFADFLEAMRDGKETLKYLLMDDEGDECFIGIDMLEVIEIPAGVIMPELYEENSFLPSSEPESLETMEVMGEA